jgi:hypothetical protein
MRDVFGEAKQRLACEIDSHSPPMSEPIVADPWIISSLLQKSIRRGETQIAQRAALTLLKLRGSGIWRRFMGIAFEDVGVGSIDAVTTVVAAGFDAALRESCGGNVRVAAHLAGLLADAPKDRSADYLVGAMDHPALARFAETMAKAPLQARLSSVCDKTLTLPQRAVSASESGNADRDAPVGLFRELGVPEALVVATGIAAARTREPITLMVPLIWLTAQSSNEITVMDCTVPPLVEAGGVPLYALDQHTRLGRAAIWRLACENHGVRTCLEHFVPASRRRRAAYVAAFYVDGAPVARRLKWDQSEALETFGIERDLLHAGVPAEGIKPLLEVMRTNLGHLNALRADILVRSQALPAAMAENRGSVR